MSAAVFGSSFANAVESKVNLHSGCHCLLLMSFDEDGMDFEDLERRIRVHGMKNLRRLHS